MLLKLLLQKFKLNEIRFGTLLIFLKDMFRTHSDRNIFGAKYAFKKEKSVVAHPRLLKYNIWETRLLKLLLPHFECKSVECLDTVKKSMKGVTKAAQKRFTHERFLKCLET